MALITISNSPVNALSHAVRNGISASIKRFETDDNVEVAVIVGSGKVFCCGADITEFDKRSQSPHLPDIIMEVERCQKPVVAAMHGTALGGGLEVAMGAHYRIAHEATSLGMPEVKLGLIPGAGGTQRLPRLVGIDKSLDMIIGGEPIDATAALNAGLIDHVFTDGDTQAAAVLFAQTLVAGKGGKATRKSTGTATTARKLIKPTGEQCVAAMADDIMSKWQSTVSGLCANELAPKIALEALQASTTMDFQQGLKEEQRLFSALMDTPQRAGMIHAFFAERKANKIPHSADVSAKDVAHIGIVGGGMMGAGIATNALLAGFTVTLVELDTQHANIARSTIELNLDGAIRRGKLDVTQRELIEKQKLTIGTHYHSLTQADLIIEAVNEDIELKKSIFQALDAAAKPGAVLATNTSYLDINEIAACIKRPEAVMGLHFFSPAHVMKLLEVVVADQTPPELVATGFALAKRLGKRAVLAGVCDGFIGNRILAHCRKAADHMVLDGASPYQIDKAMTDYGFAMGPFAVADLAGLDIGYAARQRLTPVRHPRERYPIWADELYHEGRLGQKAGKGYYLYSPGSHKGVEDPYVEELVAQSRHEAGLQPRAFSDDEIVTRYLCAMVNEAARIVEEGIALRPSDVDVILLHGYGFPRWRGGPMHSADQLGLRSVLDNIQLFAEEDNYFWQTAPLLERLIAERKNFNSLN